MAKKTDKAKDKKKAPAPKKKAAAKPAPKKAAPKKKDAPKKDLHKKEPAKKDAHKKPSAKAKKSVVSHKATAAPKKPVAKKSPAPAHPPAPKKPVAKAAAPKPTKPEPKPEPKAAPKPVAEKAARRGKEPEPNAVEDEEAHEEDESEEVVLTDAEGRRYCRVKDCDQVATVDGYCRFHYLLYWKKIQVRKKILTEGKLERYIEELTARYPDKFLDMLRKDLRSEKEFLAAIQELEIDESATEGEFEDETANYIEEVRGMGEGGGGGGRDDEDF